MEPLPGLGCRVVRLRFSNGRPSSVGKFANLVDTLYTSNKFVSPDCDFMDLSRFTTEELEHLLKTLPAEIQKRESEDDDAERRKRSVFAGFQELAKKQGIDLSKL